MKKAVFAGAALCAIMASPVWGDVTFVNDNWNPANGTDELNLYEIYNDLYGTSFTSTNGAEMDGGMDHLFVEEDGLFGAGASQDGMATFVARYAGYQQRFGYYTVGQGGPTGDPTTGVDNGDFHFLFDVINPGNTVSPMGTAVLPLGDFPIGFFDNAPLGNTRTWYSEEGENFDGRDHMVVYRAMVNGELSMDTFLIAFEDLYRLGDTDYNDLVVEVTIPNFFAPPPAVPEPATAALLLVGLAGVALRKRFTV